MVRRAETTALTKLGIVRLFLIFSVFLERSQLKNKRESLGFVQIVGDQRTRGNTVTNSGVPKKMHMSNVKSVLIG